MKIYFNIYKSDKKGVTIVVQCSGDKTKADKIKDEFKIEHEKSQDENAENFINFINNRNDIKVLNTKKSGDALQIIAEMEDDQAK